MSVDVAAAIAYQQLLRQRVILSGDLSGADLIAGADTASWPKGLWGLWKKATSPTPPSIEGGDEMIHAAIVVWSLSQQKVFATATASLPATFPYIPGLLAFREVPALLEAWSKLPIRPDVIICDGQGIAHPRRCGIACHLGVELGVPTVGCAKSRLCGWNEEPGPNKGDWAELWEMSSNSKLQTPKFKIGRVLRTRSKVRPVFVSPGHLCDIEGAMRLILSSATRYRLPEPVRAAHAAAGRLLSRFVVAP